MDNMNIERGLPATVNYLLELKFYFNVVVCEETLRKYVDCK